MTNYLKLIELNFPEAYKIINPKGPRVPILISVPHSGLYIPTEIEEKFDTDLLAKKDDTDFFVDRLYSFAADLGITMIVAEYHRWYIDLNRSIENTTLYQDGRLTTSLFPSTDFFGNELYKGSKYTISEEEKNFRITNVYNTYYSKIAEILTNFHSEFGLALLWDAHSIRRNVPTINIKPFEDLILGTNSDTSASLKIIELLNRTIQQSNFGLSNNDPFKGGNITRHFGKPDTGRHAIQLEMSKDLYLDDNQFFNDVKAEGISSLLKEIFLKLIDHIGNL